MCKCQEPEHANIEVKKLRWGDDVLAAFAAPCQLVVRIQFFAVISVTDDVELHVKLRNVLLTILKRLVPLFR